MGRWLIIFTLWLDCLPEAEPVHTAEVDWIPLIQAI